MLWLQRILILVFFIIISLLGLVFLAANESPIELRFYAFDFSTTSGGAFILGVILGLLATLIATYPIIATYRFKLHRAQKKQLEVVVAGSSEAS